MIAEIVSNQYHFAVMNQKVIALQRFFNFGVTAKIIFAVFLKLYPIKWTKWVFRNP